MIEIIKNLPVPVIIVISVLAYIIIAIIFTFLLGLVTDIDEEYASDYALVGLLWIVGVPILLIVKLFQLLLLLSYTTYYKANEISLRHRKKHRKR